MSGPMFVSMDASKSSPPPPNAAVADIDTAGYVVFLVGSTRFAVSVLEVLEVLRSDALRVLPGSGHEVNGRALGLVDARGHSVAVIDLRGTPDGPGDVLVPVDAMHVGVVVDRVESVLDQESLRPEDSDVYGLPAYARGVLRRPDGSNPVLLVSMPRAPSLTDEHDSNTIFEPKTAPVFT